MSELRKKIVNGERPSAEDWSEYLLEAHRRSPSQTPRTFADYRTADGKTSYEILAQSLEEAAAPEASVLDLACGDGFLIPFLLGSIGPQGRIVGVDMSEAELAVARQKIWDSRVSFHCSKAQSLPLEAATLDYALCHMAIMLMLPVEPVVSELVRVLRPGGHFSAVIGNRAARKGLWAEVVGKSFAFAHDRCPMIQETPTGDPRFNTEQGLEELFGKETGFSGVDKRVDFELNVTTTADGIWDFMRDMYFVGMLAEIDQLGLKELLIGLGQKNKDMDGLVRFQFPMRKFETSRL